ncbi:Cell cycle protein [Candidatus Phytoplasma australiense]|uniref:tRNA(Ile)-lysidine synthase n=2 Tax=Phytoplasma australiense TaxID=59748 RepID=B1VA48_PHYAS|nr:tRNA lysidine(34) synthetase TilS [Candidatus Phytoplasma australiense]AGL90195.1 tRNA(Ile)-lysidine synthase [Strawberry lethal yellows phytoplasma (CPA) str. NZSb11]CAM11821.1 Cell cycle protein [Candidatus Phytoplasma australiense]
MKLALKLDFQKTYIIAVSGGVDSMVLLDFLWSQKYKLKVVHFNHLKRLNAIKDKNLIQSYCDQRKIPFYYFELQLNPQNFQTEARLLRQEKLKQIAKKYQTPYVITAHHLDDLAETILQKISRGSTLLGYSGMQPKLFFEEFIFLKPFLYLAKAEIIAYAQKNKIAYLSDYTNQLDIYQRNQIRNHVIPYLKEKTNFLQNIKKFSCLLSETQDFIRKQTLFFIQHNKAPKESFFSFQKDTNFFLIKSFLFLDKVIQKDIIIYLLEQKRIDKNWLVVESIIKGLAFAKNPNLSWKLNSNYDLIKSYNYFGIIALDGFLKFKKKFFKKPLLYASTCKVCLASLQQVITLNCDLVNIAFPLKLRQRKPGDYLKFSFGKQKLKNFLINKKVPLFERDNLWLIVDSKDNVLWIPHLYINHTLGNKDLFSLGLKKETFNYL